ncbi:MAG: thioredoxin family protein [Rhodomicrobiaceae bacterium]
MIRRFSLVFIALVFTAVAAQAGSLKPYQANAFEQAMSAGKTVIVHVHAEWCPVCHRQVPALQALADDPALADAEFIQVNFDKDRDFLQANRISGQSVILVFREGREVERLIGVTDSARIQSAVKAAVS